MPTQCFSQLPSSQQSAFFGQSHLNRAHHNFFINEEMADLPVSTFSVVHTFNLPVTAFLASLEKNFFDYVCCSLVAAQTTQLEASGKFLRQKLQARDTLYMFLWFTYFIDQNILLLSSPETRPERRIYRTQSNI